MVILFFKEILIQYSDLRQECKEVVTYVTLQFDKIFL